MPKRSRTTYRSVAVGGFALLAVFVAAAAALGGRTGAQPNAVTGQKQFKSAGCGGCHTFAAAKSKGKIGPNLDAATLSLAQIQKQITVGGYSVIGLKFKKKYPAPMSAYKGKLSTGEIANIAAFVFISRDPTAVPKGSSPGSSSGGGGGGAGGGGGGGGAAGGGGGGAGGGGGGGTTTSGGSNNGCAPGQTIQSTGATDNDDDENGGPTDNDGCV